jgi:hypothetical protein
MENVLRSEMFWEILQIKVEFEQTSWKQTPKLKNLSILEIANL